MLCAFLPETFRISPIFVLHVGRSAAEARMGTSIIPPPSYKLEALLLYCYEVVNFELRSGEFFEHKLLHGA